MLKDMTLETALNEYEDGFCVLVNDGKRITLTNSDEEFCYQLLNNREAV